MFPSFFDRDKFDSDLEGKFRLLKENDRLKCLSNHISKLFHDEEMSKSEDALGLLSAWRDFVVSLAKVNVSDDWQIIHFMFTHYNSLATVRTI